MCRGKYKHRRMPILINSWEAADFDIDAQRVLQLASETAKQGIEMLVKWVKLLLQYKRLPLPEMAGKGISGREVIRWVYFRYSLSY